MSLFIDNHGRNFWPEISVYPSARIPESPERDKLFGNAQAGDYNYEIICSRDAALNFIAVYFRITQHAMVFRPESGKLPYGHMIEDVPVDNAHQFLEEKYGIPLWRVSLKKRLDGRYAITEFGYPY